MEMFIWCFCRISRLLTWRCSVIWISQSEVWVLICWSRWRTQPTQNTAHRHDPSTFCLERTSAPYILTLHRRQQTKTSLSLCVCLCVCLCFEYCVLSVCLKLHSSLMVDLNKLLQSHLHSCQQFFFCCSGHVTHTHVQTCRTHTPQAVVQNKEICRIEILKSDVSFKQAKTKSDLN